MRAVLQRVNSASVTVDGTVTGKIGKGILVYLGITNDDTEADVDYITGKIANIRIFDDANNVPNLSLTDVGGSCLMVSQFTLYADARKGRRPGYTDAAPAAVAKPLYEKAVAKLSAIVPVETGIFQADMKVASENDGPFTILLDSRRLF
ncbi:MAG: D-aminoacyl-tRNA deacylase [Clostridia bacterium]|nr:D-aminoacyl-tRNA deacylase [Clostridia bacterium]